MIACLAVWESKFKANFQVSRSPAVRHLHLVGVVVTQAVLMHLLWVEVHQTSRRWCPAEKKSSSELLGSTSRFGWIWKTSEDDGFNGRGPHPSERLSDMCFTFCVKKNSRKFRVGLFGWLFAKSDFFGLKWLEKYITFLQYGGLMVIYYGKHQRSLIVFEYTGKTFAKKTHPITTTRRTYRPAMPPLHGSSIVVPGMEHGRHRGWHPTHSYMGNYFISLFNRRCTP